MDYKIKKVKTGNFSPLYFASNKVIRIAEEENTAYVYETSSTYFIDKLYDILKKFKDLFEEETTFSEVEDLKLNNYYQKKASLEEVITFPYIIPLSSWINSYSDNNLRRIPEGTVTVRRNFSARFFSVSIRGFTTILLYERFVKNFDALLQKIVFEESGGSLDFDEEILPSLASAFEKYPFLYDKLPNTIVSLLRINFKNSDLNVSRKEISFLRKCIERILTAMSEENQKISLKFIVLRFPDTSEEKIFDFLNSLLCGLEDKILLTKGVIAHSYKNLEISKDFLTDYIFNLPPEKRIEKIRMFLKREKSFHFTLSGGLEETTFLRDYLKKEKDVKLKATIFITYLKTLMNRKYSQGNIASCLIHALPEKVIDEKFITELFSTLENENLTGEEKGYLQSFLYVVASSRNDRQMIATLHPEIFRFRKKLQLAIKFAERRSGCKVTVPGDAIKNIPARVIEFLLESIVNRKPVEIENKEEFFRAASVIALSGSEKFDLVKKAKAIVYGDCSGTDLVQTILTLSGIPLKQKAIRIKSGLPEIIYNCYLVLKEIDKEGKDVKEYAEFIGSLFTESTGIRDDYFSERAIGQLEKRISEKKLQMAIDTVRYIKQIFTGE